MKASSEVNASSGETSSIPAKQKMFYAPLARMESFNENNAVNDDAQVCFIVHQTLSFDLNR